jgi:glycine/D-amino acid oxidase-like deaminating enzyme
MIVTRYSEGKVLGTGSSQGAIAAGYVVVARIAWSSALPHKLVLIC